MLELVLDAKRILLDQEELVMELERYLLEQYLILFRGNLLIIVNFSRLMK